MCTFRAVKPMSLMQVQDNKCKYTHNNGSHWLSFFLSFVLFDWHIQIRLEDSLILFEVFQHSYYSAVGQIYTWPFYWLVLLLLLLLLILLLGLYAKTEKKNTRTCKSTSKTITTIYSSLLFGPVSDSLTSVLANFNQLLENYLAVSFHLAARTGFYVIDQQISWWIMRSNWPRWA